MTLRNEGVRHGVVMTVLLGVLSGLALTPSAAADDIPADLEVWSDWVVRDVEDYGCPIHFNSDSRRCGFPGDLELVLDAGGGRFMQTWRVFRATRVPLPGNREHWPLSVTVDDEPATVIERNGIPVLSLERGNHVIRGRFDWSQLPSALVVPPESGLVSLRLGDRGVERPEIRGDRLWLSDSGPRVDAARRTGIKVFRKVGDAVPLTVTTRIELDVSGDQREQVLAGALLNGFEPVALTSRLPARLDADGNLVLKLRAGRWVVDVQSRLNRETLDLQLDAFPAPWPGDELWVFEAQPQLRMVKVTSPESIDASQTALPPEWQSLPAYQMQAGGSLLLEQIRRGDPQPEPDQLTLRRDLWLDFTGAGWTINDRISGTLSRGWRINAGPGLVPGQVTLDGEPQLITRAEDGSTGVEVRQGNVQLTADSRVEGTAHEFSATGWRHDFRQVAATIHVPPGYRVFAIGGADRATSTWLSQWTLLDFFIVLISSIALSKLHGLRWGAVGLVGLVALWHEPGAPTWIWLNLIATLALLRVVRETRAYPLVRNYLVLSAAALLLLALPFLVDQVREGIYPQLEQPWQALGARQADRQARLQQAEPRVPDAEQQAGSGPSLLKEYAADSVSGLASSIEYDERKVRSGAPGRLLQDPGARLQTGPGLPDWDWRSYPVSWNGPVQQGQRLEVHLIPPWQNLLFNLFRVTVVVLLAWKLVRSPVRELLRHATPAAGTAVLALLMVGTLGSPAPVLAAFPSKELLSDLRKQLLEPAQCLPQCAQLERLSIALDPHQARLALRVHAEQDLSLPLPVPLNDWMPSAVTVDGEPAGALLRDAGAVLWLYVEQGIHDVVVTGRVAELRALRLDFRLPPHALDISLEGWSRDGADSLEPVPASLSFTREQAGAGADSFDTRSDIPVFAQVERRLRLGVDWRVDTTVQLVSGTALPAVLRIPLLEGEAVLAEHVRVQDGLAIISLAEHSRVVRWQSTLEQRDELTLAAGEGQPWSETWSVEVAPIWNVRLDGIPVVYHQQADGLWHPQWRPWPGEQVRLSITRPQAIEGATLTIDRSRLMLIPGKRATAAELELTLRSSLGQQHAIRLPEGAQLESVSIDAKAVPIRQDGRSVTLPLTPGSQQVSLKWREPRGIDWRFSSSPVDLGLSSVNAGIVVRPGGDRWILLTGGVRQGPAVLFWGVLIVVVLIALALGRVKGTPLNTGSWILLGIGLSTVTPFSALVVALWIFALYARGRIRATSTPLRFNFMQVMLVVLTFAALATLFGAVSNGLLGNPEMQVAGNGSHYGQLNWYQDRIGNELPRTWLLSVPVMVYRFLMLAWSMWMAFALIRWLRWGWGCYSTGQLWMPRSHKGGKEEVTEN